MRVNKIAGPIYAIALIIINAIYAFTFLGVFATVPEFIKTLHIIVQVFLCFFLMLRFHPFQQYTYVDQYDNMYIFGAGSILFVNIVLVEILKIPTVGPWINAKINEIHSKISLNKSNQNKSNQNKSNSNTVE